MNRYCKTLFCAFLLAIVPLFFVKYSHAQTNYAYEEIMQYDTRIDVLVDGRILVSEFISYQFPEERHGIIRTIPLLKENAEGKAFKMTVTDVSVTDVSDNPYVFSVNTRGDDLEIKIGDPNRKVVGEQMYKIQYSVSGALTYFENHDELYWNVIGTDWEVPIRKVTTIITLPPEVRGYPATIICYTGQQGSTASDCITGSFMSVGHLTVTVNQGLGPKEGLTAAVTFAPNIVERLEPLPKYAPLNNIQKVFLGFALLTALIVFVIWNVVVPLRVFRAWYRNKKELRNTKIVAAWFDPPKDETGKHFTPAETSLTVNLKSDHKNVTATIVRLAQKGLLKIHEDAGKFSLILLDKKEVEDLEEYEKDLLNVLRKLSKDSTVSLKTLSKSTVFGKEIASIHKKVSQSVYSKNVFTEDPKNFVAKQIFLLVAAFMTFNIPLFLAVIFFGLKSLRYTPFGLEKYGEARSLKNFLVSQDEQLDFQAKNQYFFERLLPYATAFGVEETWALRFSDIKFSQPEWYEGQGFNMGAYSAFSRNLTTVSRQAVASSATSSSRGFSSGSSGGFSGGGGGGGGGRSW